MALAKIRGVRRDLVGNDAIANILLVGKPEMLLRGHITEHCGSIPSNHRGTDRTGDVIIPRCDIRGEWPQRVKGGLMTMLELFFHIGLDHVHRDMTWSLNHHLDIMLPSHLSQLTQRVEFGKLSRIIGIGNRSWPEAIA